MTAPSIHTSTIEERIAYVEDQWQCLNHCASCGKCNILKGKDEKELFAEYIECKKEYLEINNELRYR